MSVTFSPAPHSPDSLNMANPHARELLIWLGITPRTDLCGEMSAENLATKCRVHLGMLPVGGDPGVAVTESARGTNFGRREDYLPEKAQALLAICNQHPNATISWY